MELHTLYKRPELRLLFHSVGSHPEPNTTQHLLASRPGQNFNWEYLLDASRQHGVYPLLYHAVTATDHELVPTNVLNQLRDHFRLLVVRNQLLARELTRLLRLLKVQSIQAIPFKGPTLAVLAYGALSLRPFADLDLLVCHRDLEGAKQILEAEGYRPYYRAYVGPITRLSEAQRRSYLHNYHEYELRRDDGTQIDLHWHTAPRRFPFRLDPQRLRSTLQTVSLEGENVSTFTTENLLLFLCMHGAKEQWRKLAWIVDLDRLLRAQTGIDWDAVCREARISHGQHALRFGLGLTHDLLGTAVPRVVLNGSTTWQTSAPLTRRVYDSLFTDKDRKHDLSRCGPVKRLHIALCHNLRDTMIYIHRSLTTSTPPDWSRVPLPDVLFWLYRGVKPLLITAKCAMILRRKLTGEWRRPHRAGH